MMRLTMHTDNWRCLSGSLEQAVQAAKRFGLEYIEFGVIDGQDFVQGLGYSPAVSLDSNPVRLRRYLDSQGLRPSQLDAAYPITGPLGATFGVRYVQRAIQFAAAIGCPFVDTTDGQFKPEGYSDDEVLAITRENFRQILPWAEDYKVTVNIETHGPYTTNPDLLDRMLHFFDTPYLRFNLDTGNTFIAGARLSRAVDYLSPYVFSVVILNEQSEVKNLAAVALVPPDEFRRFFPFARRRPSAFAFVWAHLARPRKRQGNEKGRQR